eukprot:223695_1
MSVRGPDGATNISFVQVDEDEIRQFLSQKTYLNSQSDSNSSQSDLNSSGISYSGSSSPNPPDASMDPIRVDPSNKLPICSLNDELPTFSSDESVIWYQHLDFFTVRKIPFYVTYPAQWCWDIECQRLQFHEQYAINPTHAENVHSRFSIHGDSHPNDANQWMFCDLLNMKVTHPNTGDEYELKRTDKLVGSITDYGQIAFDRYYSSEHAETFLYDRVTGYASTSGEDDLKIGDRVAFEVWWNKDDDDGYYYDISERETNGAHLDMFAFNVRSIVPDAADTPPTGIKPRALAQPPERVNPREDDECIQVTLEASQWTTPTLNMLSIPPNTVNGHVVLTKRVDLKLNAMMKVMEYMLDPRWPVILTMASSSLYNAQRTAWMLMRSLEMDKMALRETSDDVPEPVSEEEEEEVVSVACSDSSEESKEDPSLKDVPLDTHGLPVLQDKSKYKMVSVAYCQKMGWKPPTESVQIVPNGYSATACFGPLGNEVTACGRGVRQKNAIYSAYMQLAVTVIPKERAIELMKKFIPQYQNKEMRNKHPKTRVVEWAQKHKIAAPKTKFKHVVDEGLKVRAWTASATFCGRTVECTRTKKKEAEFVCYEELLGHILF